MLQTNSYIMHYGIPGQKWGVRRYQNEDGTLTEEGMRKYGIGERLHGQFNPSEKIRQSYNNWQIRNHSAIQKVNQEKQNKKQLSKRRLDLIDKYKNKGLSQEQAEIQAYKRERTEKWLKIAGGVALATAAAYAVHKGVQYHQQWGDRTIKEGQNIQRILRSPNVDPTNSAYVSINKADNTKYSGMLGNAIKDERRTVQKLAGANAKSADFDAYKMTAKAGGKMKIAGERTGQKTFDELLKNDKEFAKDFDSLKTRLGVKDTGIMGEKTNMYDVFNRNMYSKDFKDSVSLQKRFTEALQKKGYSGVIDVNDRRYSGQFKTKDPVYMFNLKDKISDMKITQMGNDEVAKDYKRAQELISRSNLRELNISKLEKLGKKIIGIGAIALGTGAVSSKISDHNATKNSAKYRMVINEYKKDHPGTKLSDKEILNNYFKT